MSGRDVRILIGWVLVIGGLIGLRWYLPAGCPQFHTSIGPAVADGSTASLVAACPDVTGSQARIALLADLGFVLVYLTVSLVALSRASGSPALRPAVRHLALALMLLPILGALADAAENLLSLAVLGTGEALIVSHRVPPVGVASAAKWLGVAGALVGLVFWVIAMTAEWRAVRRAEPVAVG